MRKLFLLLALMMGVVNTATAAEAYAVYNNSTLTFYYDDIRSSRYGTTYDATGSLSSSDDRWLGHKNSINFVIFDATFANARPTGTAYWFYACYYLTSITGIQYLNTSQATNMYGMFYWCYKLTSLDVSNFNTANVTDMTHMFNGCSSLVSLDVSNFNTTNVTYMNEMFKGCSVLKTIYCSDSWSPSYSFDMFKDCTYLVNKISGLSYDSSKTDATYANPTTGYFTPLAKPYAVYTGSNNTLTFYYDNQSAIRPGISYDLDKYNSGNLPYWVEYKDVIQHVVFDTSFSTARPTLTRSWFSGMTQLRDITDIQYLNTEKVTSMSSMFFNCQSLTNIDLTSFNTDNVTYMTNMFTACSGLTSLDLSSFNTAKVTSMNSMFYNCSNLKTIIVGDNWTTSAVDDSYNMFYGCTSIVGRNGTTFDANHVDKEYARLDNAPVSPGYLSDINHITPIEPTTYNVNLIVEASAPLSYFITNNFWVRPNYGEYDNLYANQSATYTLSENSNFSFEMDNQEDQTWGITWSPAAVYVNGKDRTEDISWDMTTWFELESLTGDTEIRVVFEPDCDFVRVMSLGPDLLWTRADGDERLIDCAEGDNYYVPVIKNGEGVVVRTDLIGQSPDNYDVIYWKNNGRYLLGQFTMDQGGVELTPDGKNFQFKLLPGVKDQDRIIGIYPKATGMVETTEWTVVKTAEVEDAEVRVSVEGGEEETTALTDACTEIDVSNAEYAQLRVKGLVSSSTYDLYLNAYTQELAVVKAVKELTGLGLVETKALVESAPVKVKGFTTRAEAEAAMATLTAIEGTQCSVKSPGVGTFVKVLRNGVDVTADMTPDGDYLMMNVDAADLTRTTWVLTTEELINRFDTNNDGTVDISDVTKLVNEVLNK